MADPAPPHSGLALGVVAALAVAATLSILLTVGGALPTPEQLASWLRGFGVWAPVALVLLMVAHSFLPVPGEVLALCAGALFGTIAGAALIWIGAMIGAALSFWLARWLGRGFVAARLRPRQVERLDHWTRDWGAMALLGCRLFPAIAFNLINYAAGLTPVRFSTFLWTTAIGILPVTLLSTWLGERMLHLTWPVLLTISAVAIALVWGGYTLLQLRNGRP